MNSILAVEKGLPPGLWVPLPDGPTDRYRTENYRRNDLPYEDIVDLGAFAVARIMRAAPETGRVSFMPRKQDVDEMFHDGFGLSSRRLQRFYGGIRRLDYALGFYPDGVTPSREDLFKRLRWMATYALDLEQDLHGSKDIRQVIKWGTDRDLLPGVAVIYSSLGDAATIDIQRIFAIEKPNSRQQLTYLDVYRFGAQVLKDNQGVPLSQIELDERYKGYFLAKPYNVVRSFFSSMNKFWMEFGLVTDTKGMGKKELGDIGIRHAIQTGVSEFTDKIVANLSAQNKFPSEAPLRRFFKGIPGYRKYVTDKYGTYLALRDELVTQKVLPEVVQLACQKFEATDEFKGWLKQHTSVLQALSQDLPSARYALRIMERGFDLLDEAIFEMQFIDLKNRLKTLGIKEEADVRFVFTVIPRFDPDEALALRAK